jgi:hypothetical protein
MGLLYLYFLYGIVSYKTGISNINVIKKLKYEIHTHDCGDSNPTVVMRLVYFTSI